MNLKEIYLDEKNKNRKYCSITKVNKENIKLEMKPIQKITDNWIVLLAILVVIIGLLILNFNIKYFLVSLALIASFVIIFIFGNRAVIICDKNTLNIKQGFQKSNIPYSNLKNVYIGRVMDSPFLFPSRSYNIVIRYEDNFNFLRELEFSLLCADEKEVNEFINNFTIEEKVEEKYVIYEKRKFWRRIFSALLTVTLFVIILVYVLK